MRLESSIQAEIIKKLKKRPNSDTFKSPPSPTGQPDINHLETIQFYFEVKRSEDHKPTEIQLYRHKKLRKAGAIVTVVWNWEQVEKVLKKHLSNK